ncbi:efflux RND transporter periplasmic adaptor subunit [Burkholderia sp. Ac-20365]|uniref:efflux RND transporter periplasmic adaptor subunit n=1 Tax=Burkholderia sp. Ac-20365 TaxID=2703897 RepID=UPI00197B16EA|nr:efflux RND transporter periplasmic adaptor subunit [Burkholderia sp. Ac-20365]MBN3765808.1 efflux RND transporter periplasmic adaptor subunit [Burkholderia sp. Ac-20365]
MSYEPTQRNTLAQRQLSLAVMIGGLLAILIVAGGIAIRVKSEHQLKDWTEAQAIPTVNVVAPMRDVKGGSLDLPGRLEAFASAPIHARVSGYLKSWRVDIGSQVKAGDTLAEIETPELDQQLNQAKADLVSAQADAALAKTTAKRWQDLLDTDSVSRQEVDERTQGYATRQARVVAAQANVDRLVATKNFARIVAPFDGVITSRDTDVGALINAGSGSGPQLFSVSSVDKLRVYVHVPQEYAPVIKTGGTAEFTVPEYPGKTFTAKVAALADSIDAASGTTLVQLLVDNSDHLLRPGAFVNLHFALPVRDGALRVPASALIFDRQGLRLATIDSRDTVHFKSVEIVQDLGNAVEIGSGLTVSDRVIDTPPDGLIDGDRVQVAGTGTKAEKHD